MGEQLSSGIQHNNIATSLEIICKKKALIKLRNMPLKKLVNYCKRRKATLVIEDGELKDLIIPFPYKM